MRINNFIGLFNPLTTAEKRLESANFAARLQDGGQALVHAPGDEASEIKSKDGLLGGSIVDTATKTNKSYVVNGLLGLQEHANFATNSVEQQAIKIAQNMLVGLEIIRENMLTGASISPGALQMLKENILQKRKISSNPKLQELLDEAELRLEVELAKLERGSL